MLLLDLAVQTVASVHLLTKREHWVGLPLFAWGGSAGGTFAARLPYFLPMKVKAGSGVTSCCTGHLLWLHMRAVAAPLCGLEHEACGRTSVMSAETDKLSSPHCRASWCS